MSQSTFTVPNISCSHCVKTIQREVSQIGGIRFITGDPARKTVTVEIADDQALSRFKALMNEIGYPIKA